MQVLALISMLVIAVAVAEPPQRYRNAANKAYGAPEEGNEAPYPPSGWRPSGRQFVLPARQSSYYIPPPPPPAYGPPSTTETPTTEEPTTTEAEPTTTEAATTEKPEEEEFADGARAFSSASAKDREADDSGVYYVLLPDGRLQRVAYSTNPNGVAPEPPAQIRNAGYVQFRYMDVEPIRAPIYSYGAPLVRIFK